MRIPLWKRILFVVLSVGIIVSAAFYVLAKKYAKPLLQYQLTRIFDQPIHIRAIKVIPPVGISLRDFRVPGVVESEAITFQLIWPNIFSKEWFIHEVRLERPTVFLTAPVTATLPAASQPPGRGPAQTSLPTKVSESATKILGKDWGMNVARLTVQDGRVLYRDEGRGLAVEIKNFYLAVRSLTFPARPGRTNFSLRGAVETRGLPIIDSHAEGRGWINWARRDLAADIVLKTDEGKKILSARALAKSNNLEVTGRMKMNSRLLMPAKAGENFLVTDLLAAAARTAGLQVDLGFKFNTLLDQFEVSKISFSGDLNYSVPTGDALKKLQEKVLATPQETPSAP